MVNRRDMLTVIAGTGLTLTAGCLDDTAEEGGDDDDATGEDGTELTELSLSLASVDGDLAPLSFDIDVVTDRLSEADLPTLDIRVENIGDELVSWEFVESEFVFPAISTTPTGLMINLENKIENMLEDGEGCRYVSGIGFDDVPVVTELEPGESLEQRYAFAASESALEGACPPADVYRTEYEYEDYGTWGFEVELAVA